jgi:ribosomal protein L35AE/L33A
MIILQIEHKVPNFDGWKKVFESDPIDRKKSGVLSYRIYRPVDDPNYVIIDLQFENLKDAEAALAALRNLWVQAEGKVIISPQARIFDVVESKVY